MFSNWIPVGRLIGSSPTPLVILFKGLVIECRSVSWFPEMPNANSVVLWNNLSVRLFLIEFKDLIVWLAVLY